MAIDVKTRFTEFLPGAGKDSAGAPVQGKTRVVGIIDVTSYSGEEGEPLKARDLGLTNIDSIHLRNQEQLDGNANGGSERNVWYAKGTGHFYLGTTLLASGAVTHIAAGATETLEFDAFGDSAHNVELV